MNSFTYFAGEDFITRKIANFECNIPIIIDGIDEEIFPKVKEKLLFNFGKRAIAVILDEGGNPVQGCMVQVCKDTCLPAISNAEGIATFSLQIEDGHKLQVSSCPDGYEYDGEADIYLEVGQKEYTLVLKAVK